MLQPKRTKYRKMQKGKVKGMATRCHQIAFGSFALKSLEAGWITARQLEAARVAVTRAMKREGQVWIRIFPDKQLPASLLRFVWVKVKVLPNIG